MRRELPVALRRVDLCRGRAVLSQLLFPSDVHRRQRAEDDARPARAATDAERGTRLPAHDVAPSPRGERGPHRGRGADVAAVDVGDPDVGGDPDIGGDPDVGGLRRRRAECRRRCARRVGCAACDVGGLQRRRIAGRGALSAPRPDRRPPARTRARRVGPRAARRVRADARRKSRRVLSIAISRAGANRRRQPRRR